MDGTRECQRKLEMIAPLMQMKAQGTIIKRALIIQTELRQKLSQGGGGRQYRRGGVIHTASAPGEPPATDTGRLKGSIGMFLFRGGLAAEIGTRLVPYPQILEEGSPGGKIAKRPFLAPTWSIQEPLYLEDMRAAVLSLEKGL